MQNSFPSDTKLNKIHVKKKVKFISPFEFSILYTTVPHKLPIKELSETINFVFKFKVSKHTGIFKTSVYWTSKGAGRR